MTTAQHKPAAERFVEEMLGLVAEKGGSRDVKLREVSRRVGCAHTNVYNYFTSFADLRWAAFLRTLRLYEAAIVDGLDDSLPSLDYLRRLVTNLVAFPEENPGLYRFIGSDPIDFDAMPAEIVDTVVTMKRWLVDAFVACAPEAVATEAEEACTIVHAYIDGETLNLINGRVVPGEDVEGRIVDNSLRLFELLTEPRVLEGTR
jgi:AcrR family transcriptional regulator